MHNHVVYSSRLLRAVGYRVEEVVCLVYDYERVIQRAAELFRVLDIEHVLFRVAKRGPLYMTQHGRGVEGYKLDPLQELLRRYGERGVGLYIFAGVRAEVVVQRLRGHKKHAATLV